MEARRSTIAIKLLPSLADFAFLLPTIVLFFRMGGTTTLLSDGDPGWHIRTGDWILAHHRVPTGDLFSYTKPGQTWYAWEWLSEIVFSWLNSHFGLAAVLLLAVVLLSTTFALVFRMARRHSNPFAAIAVTLFGATASSVHWLARPHLFTLLFAVLFYAALERVREGRTRLAGIPYLAILPVATILWTNLHGGFFVGILLIAGYAAGELLAAAFTAEAEVRNAALRRAGSYLASATACLAASLINPYSWRLDAHVLAYVFDPYQGQHIDEFLSLSFHHPSAIFFECLLLAGVGTAFWHLAHRSYIQPVLLLMWAHAALLATRNIPVFAIVAAPPVAAVADRLLKRIPDWNAAAWLRAAARKFNQVAARTADTDAIPRWHAFSAVVLAAVAALLYAPAPPEKFRPEYNPRRYPAGAVEVLRNDPAARIFTTDVWGGYLIYRLYPRTKVFMDGRSDFYGPDFGQKYTDIVRVNDDWEQTLESFDVNTVLMPTGTPLAGALKMSRRWRVVYDDHVAVVFRAARSGQTVSANASCGADDRLLSSAARQAAKNDGLPHAKVGGGPSRDREITKTEARDRAIAELKSKT